MAAFTGQLNTNEVFSTIFNQIISYQIFPTGVEGLDGVYSARKVDGTLYGDTKVYRSADVLQSYGWTHSDSTYSLLTQKRPPNPKVDEIVIDTFRQIPLTVDDYLSKRAYQDEGTFASMNGVFLDWLQGTKDVYEHTTYTVNLLTSAKANATALATIDLKATTLGGTPSGRDLVLWRSQELYRVVEDQLKELKEPSREYNDLAFLRSYKPSDFKIYIPLGVLSSVRKHDIPFLYNKDDKNALEFEEVHWKYFGAIDAAGGTTAADNETTGLKRALVEKEYGGTNYFPGDIIPNSTVFAANEAYTSTYGVTRPGIDDDITMLIVHKQDYPIMSAFSVGTSFFNAKTLATNHYLTFGHNDVYDAHLRERALLSIATDVA